MCVMDTEYCHLILESELHCNIWKTWRIYEVGTDIKLLLMIGELKDLTMHSINSVLHAYRSG